MGTAILNPYDILETALAPPPTMKNTETRKSNRHDRKIKTTYRSNNYSSRSPLTSKDSASNSSRSPLTSKDSASNSSCSPLTSKASSYSNPAKGHVKVLKRGKGIEGENIDPDLGSTERIWPDTESVKCQIRVPASKSVAPYYAGSSIFVPPPSPSTLPLPLFFAKSSSSLPIGVDAIESIDELMRTLSLDTS